MQSRETILAPGLISADVQVQPALNVLNSHQLLGMASIRSGLDSWVYETSARLTVDQSHKAKMLYWGIPGITTLEQNENWASFEDFLAAYEAIDAVAIIHRDAAMWCEAGKKHGMEDAPTLDDVIADRERYIDVLMKVDDPELTYEIAGACHRFLTHPVEMHQMSVAHLWEMWEKYLQPEWDRRQHEVEASVEALAGLTTPQTTLVETVRRITGRDISSWMGEDFYNQLEAAIFVPSPHMGPYITVEPATRPRTARFIIGARIPEIAAVRSTTAAAPGLFEMQTRLEALADPIRLQIAHMLASQAVMSTEEIMDAFDLTKSSASRHLRQLTATGLISERREGGAKKVYSLNREAAQGLIKGLETMLLD